MVLSRSSSHDACPASIFKRYASELERSPVEPSQYVFKPLTKSKLGHKFVSTNKPASYSTVRKYLNSTFKDIVPDIAAFSIHSLREQAVILLAGRWKTVLAKNDGKLESRLLVSQRFVYLSMFFYSSCSLHLPFLYLY